MNIAGSRSADCSYCLTLRDFVKRLYKARPFVIGQKNRPLVWYGIFVECLVCIINRVLITFCCASFDTNYAKHFWLDTIFSDDGVYL